MGVKIMGNDVRNEIKSFQELVLILDQASAFLAGEVFGHTNLTDEQNLDTFALSVSEKNEFKVGHFMGMRDCLIVVQGILRNQVLAEVETSGEEE